MSQVTFILTSCGRFDLLEQTMDSFLDLNDFPIHEYIIHDDSGDPKVYDQIMTKYGHIAEVMQSDRIGLSASLDKLMSCVETPYVLGWEDDWKSSGNRFFVSQALAVLHKNSAIHQVWFREHNDHKQPLSQTAIINNVPIREVMPWKEWVGFSWNPRLIRLADYMRIFPNGYAEFGDELLCNIHAAQFGYKAVTLEESTVKHIGYGRHVKDFKV